jgi:hypothetical protein
MVSFSQEFPITVHAIITDDDAAPGNPLLFPIIIPAADMQNTRGVQIHSAIRRRLIMNPRQPTKIQLWCVEQKYREQTC